MDLVSPMLSQLTYKRLRNELYLNKNETVSQKQILFLVVIDFGRLRGQSELDSESTCNLFLIKLEVLFNDFFVCDL